MGCTTWRTPVAVFGLLSLGLGLTAAEEKEGQGFKPLFNGKDLSGWKTFLDPKKGDVEPAKTWTVEDGVIKCTGNPNGYFYTEKSFKNYVLRYDWKYLKPAEGQKSTYNSGLLVHMQPPNKIWPKCIEAQGANKNHGFLYFLECKKLESHYDQAAKDKATHPIGEWNTTEVTCGADGSLAVKINGTAVASGKSDLTEGPVGFQSEGAEIHFRKIVIKEAE
jgi:3-keto-disaccharide hydrolase